MHATKGSKGGKQVGIVGAEKGGEKGRKGEREGRGRIFRRMGRKSHLHRKASHSHSQQLPEQNAFERLAKLFLFGFHPHASAPLAAGAGA